MPQPLKILKSGTLVRFPRGPRPTCTCGECDLCKARLRQQRFYWVNRERILKEKKNGKQREE